MKSMNFKQGCILSELGESRLLTEVTPATDTALQCYQSKILTGNRGNKKWCVTTRYLLILLTGNRLNPFKSIMLHVLPVLHVQNKR